MTILKGWGWNSDEFSESPDFPAIKIRDTLKRQNLDMAELICVPNYPSRSTIARIRESVDHCYHRLDTMTVGHDD